MPHEVYQQEPLPISVEAFQPQVLPPPFPACYEKQVKGGGIPVPITEGNIFTMPDTAVLRDFGSAIQAVSFVNQERKTEQNPSSFLQQTWQRTQEVTLDAFGYATDDATVQRVVGEFSAVVERRMKELSLSHNFYTSQDSSFEVRPDVVQQMDLFSPVPLPTVHEDTLEQEVAD